MSSEENKALMLRYVAEVWQQGNLAALDDFLAPDYRRYVSPNAPPMSLTEQKQRLAGVRAAFPDVRLSLEDMFAEGDRVAFRTILRGTHRGEFWGIAPTGQSVTVSLLDVVRIQAGRIVEHWGGPDFLDWLRQLGAVITVL